MYVCMFVRYVVHVFIMLLASDYTMHLVSFPDPTTHARRKGSGDIGADSWFCKLSNHAIICIGFYWRTCGHVMVRKTKKTLQCPQTLFLVRGLGLGTRLPCTQQRVKSSVVIPLLVSCRVWPGETIFLSSCHHSHIVIVHTKPPAL